MPIDPRILQLAQGDGVCLIGPAGCGKTQTIVEAAHAAGGCQLILTHTHAGVASLRARARKLGVHQDTVFIDTIASWALRYALSFPKLSGISTTQPIGAQWQDVYTALAQLLTQRHIKSLIKRSFAGLFVDEYQDCTQTQHALVMTLANLLPTRVIGDPLQSIFTFNQSDPCVTFDTDVFPLFQRLPDLDRPHRWINSGNTVLGEWLLSIRPAFESEMQIDLSGAPVSHILFTDANALAVCRQHIDSGETVIAMKQWPKDCHQMTKNLGGVFVSIEAMDCKDWLTTAGKLHTSTGAARARHLIEACAQCAHVPHNGSSVFSPIIKALAGSALPSEDQCGGSSALSQAIHAFVISSSPIAALNLIQSITKFPGMKIYRRDFWDEMKATFHLLSQESVSIPDAAWRARNNTRTHGRHLPPMVVSTTLLVKGLECDHGILLDADSYNGHRPNLYVAMTRGCKSLTILSKSPVLILS